MTINKFTCQLLKLIEGAEIQDSQDVDFIMSHLIPDATFSMTRIVDFALGPVENDIVMKAYKQGLTDETQAFAR